MTSSLVGSEMCIRDRSRSACHARHSGVTRAEINNRNPAEEQSQYWSCDCLLYTSDAADDM
eukprot:4041962-Prorocentrum_lima.AAC.1